jgi:hypothetical protein
MIIALTAINRVIIVTIIKPIGYGSDNWKRFLVCLATAKLFYQKFND